MSWMQNRIPPNLLAYAREYNPSPNIADEFAGEKFVTKDTRIVTLGSCFAQELASWLDANNYRRLAHRWGVLYNPKSILQIVSYSTGSWNPSQPYWTDGKFYYDPYRKADNHSGPVNLGSVNPEQRLEEHYEESRNTFSVADVAVITLGLTETWRHTDCGSTFYSVPSPQFYLKDKHEFHNLTYGHVVTCLWETIRGLRMLNPEMRFVLSVSPVPLVITFRHHLGAYVATQFSKSVLHAAVYEIANPVDGIYYMPSYEMARSDPANFKADGRHVTSECVSKIMKTFEELYVA